MTFEYRNPTTGDRVAAVELDGDVWLKTTSKGCLVPPDRVEELVAGIRDAARISASAPLATPCAYCSHTLNWHFPGGRCQVTAGENGCGCAAFVAPDGSHPDPERPAVGQPAEAQRTDEAPADVTFTIEKRCYTTWLTTSTHYDEAEREKALSRLARRRKQDPDTELRLVRWTTVWTVEDETR
ncbi:hypothetical protein [Streptomyces zaomyceticus]|uniref:hypothetical protein n=1 Tax=Streptomyces zaomyceticus TaxID=68286 RepID=UPI0037BB2F9A